MQNRLKEIINIINNEKRVEVVDLSNRLNVSEVTIRKDLGILEEQGILLRRYGGAVLAENPRQVVNYLKKIDVCTKEKTSIAVAAAELIEDEENIFLDAGSTTLALAREIRDKNLRVVTNSLPVVEVLSGGESILLEVVGGSLRKSSGALIGPRACKALGDICVDKVFLGCSGFDLKRGFSSENAVEAETKKKMLSCASKRIMLCDHTKFERPAFANFADINEIDILVTDKKLPDNIQKKIKKLIIAG